MDISAEIDRIVTEAPGDMEEAERLAYVRSRLSGLAGVEPAKSRTAFFNREFKLTQGLCSALAEERQKLDALAPLDLSIAPRFVSLTATDPQEIYGVLVTRYLACSGERLQATGDTPPVTTSEALRRFYEEVAMLAENQFVHPYVRGWYHVLVSSESRTLVMDDWLAMRRGSPSEINEMISHARRMTEQR